MRGMLVPEAGRRQCFNGCDSAGSHHARIAMYGRAMRTTILGAAVTLATITSCGPGRTTFARYPTAPPAFDRAASDPKAVALADKIIAAEGGMAAWNAIKQIRWAEIITNNGQTVIDQEGAWDRWNARAAARSIGDHGDLVIHHEIYGEQSEAFSEDAGKRAQLPPKDAAAAIKVSIERWQFDTAVLCTPLLLEEPGSKLSYVGQAQGETGPLEVITLAFDPRDPARAGTSYQLDVDPATSTIARIEIIKPGGNVGYKISGWTEVHGLKIPTVLNNIGLASEVVTFKDVKIGEPEDGLYVSF